MPRTRWAYPSDERWIVHEPDAPVVTLPEAFATNALLINDTRG
jgi:hypothetical protein